MDANDDDPCPCGISHTRSEHNYNPDDEGDDGTCPHGLSASLCVDPINHYPPDTPGQPGYGWH